MPPGAARALHFGPESSRPLQEMAFSKSSPRAMQSCSPTSGSVPIETRRRSCYWREIMPERRNPKLHIEGHRTVAVREAGDRGRAREAFRGVSNAGAESSTDGTTLGDDHERETVEGKLRAAAGPFCPSERDRSARDWLSWCAESMDVCLSHRQSIDGRRRRGAGHRPGHGGCCESTNGGE
jgi:hypothetical protein